MKGVRVPAPVILPSAGPITRQREFFLRPAAIAAPGVPITVAVAGPAGVAMVMVELGTRLSPTPV